MASNANVTNVASRWLLVAAYALAMAWVEAAVVLDLRVLVNRIEPYQSNPLPLNGLLGGTELVRELATMIMLACVGVLAGSSLTTRAGYFAGAFGVWDIAYYAFLKTLTGWPHGLTDWDILFLLPLPWWGPVWAPMAIALLMILAGVCVTLPGGEGRMSACSYRVWFACALGIVTALWAFMNDALAALPHGAEAVRNTLPDQFNVPLFLGALLLMGIPVLKLWRGTAGVYCR